MAEESFEVRVKRLFGSHLFDKVPSSAFSDKAWSVASGEVERHQWNRSSASDDEEGEGSAVDRGDVPCSSAFYDPEGCLAEGKRGKSRIDAEIDEEEEEEDGKGAAEGEEEDERDVRSSIGLDPTLDNEEEEDVYDRAAFGQDKAAERVYMNQVMDHGPHISIYSVVPEVYDSCAHDFRRDPRADRSAACKRIKEDTGDVPGRPRNTPKVTESDPNLKPILKRRDTEDDSKPKKRVRFDPEFEEEKKFASQAAPQVMEKDNKGNGVPDYIKNPAKYTKYTFSSSDDNDEDQNRRAFQDFQSLINRSNSNKTELDPSFELPASVTFTPRKKIIEDAMSIDVNPPITNEVTAASSSSCLNAAVGNDACEMDEDVVEEKNTVATKSTGTTKPARRYRSKAADEE